MNREHLYRAAVLAMRQVLTDHHRRRNRAKRSGRWHQHPVEVALNRVTRDDRIDLEALNEALDHLAVVDSRACLVTAFHSFLRMPLGEVAEALGISPSTAERDWHFARVWLRGRLGSELPEA
jgi:RNA polymerase sigma factor (TIGR02999 family)